MFIQKKSKSPILLGNHFWLYSGGSSRPQAAGTEKPVLLCEQTNRRTYVPIQDASPTSPCILHLSSCADVSPAGSYRQLHLFLRT